MFIENRFEIYLTRNIVEIELPKKTEVEKAAENRHSTVYELIEKTRNTYWRIEDNDDVGQKSAFIEALKSSLEFNTSFSDSNNIKMNEKKNLNAKQFDNL
ncbi:28825_t:CDS:2 [Gigaspora margarita]|uniref:28825_t:CDS:1 n=1 Tax=Gigaspora margarita TaxID=4874 RepID=A0ABM8W4E8_GIGMA|nr:28825_t:CDS:2 [Gigaspora margarita]